MSGKIELEVRKSKVKWLKNLNYYPGWIWKITGENGEIIKIMPKWDDIEKAIEETIIHELKVDIITNRNPDRQRYQKFLTNMLKKCKELQTKIIDYSEIEEIYTRCKK